MEDEIRPTGGDPEEDAKKPDGLYSSAMTSLWGNARHLLETTKTAAGKYWNQAGKDIAKALAFQKEISRRVAASNIPEAAKRRIQERLQEGLKSVQSTGRQAVSELTIWTNALLTTEYRHDIESWLKRFNEGMPSDFDKALDEVYKNTSIGGGKLHRLFDGNHTIPGAWSAIDESQLTSDADISEKVSGWITALAKDFSSPVGLPLFTWNEEGYGQVASFLSEHFDIPREWFSDLLHVDAGEAIGCSMSVLAAALNWNKAQVEDFGRLAASSGITSVAAGNPALCILGLVILGKAYTDCQDGKDYKKLIEGIAKGGIGTGVFMVTSAVIGGPAWIGILTGTCIGVAVNRSMKHVTLEDVAKFVDVSMQRAIDGIRASPGNPENPIIQS